LHAGTAALTVLGLFLASGAANAADLPPLSALNRIGEAETFQAAKLIATEIAEIVSQVERTAFDTPESWEKELRVRRVRFPSSDGLVLQGTKLLCGATGNCQTWVFRQDQGQWIALFPTQAPLAAGFSFITALQQPVPQFMVAAHLSADVAVYRYYFFNGQTYSTDRCFESKPDGHAAKQVTCTPPAKP